MKTKEEIKRYLESKGLLDKVIYNYNHHNKLTNPVPPITSIYHIAFPERSFMKWSFDWCDTPEGCEFWYKASTAYLLWYDN